MTFPGQRLRPWLGLLHLALAQASLAYEVQAESAQAARLRWQGPSRWSADEVVGGLTRGWQRAQARAFLQTLLRDGPRLAREGWAEAQKQGLSERTLKRAKKEMGILSQQGLHNGLPLSHWLPPEQGLPAAVRLPGPADLEEWLAPLRAGYPASTPLDEDE